MYTGIQFANNASTQLAQACTASDTTLTVGENATAAFPKINSVSDYFMLTLADTNGHYEIVKCTAKTETTFTVVRAQEGTTARPYPTGALLENRLTAAGIVHIAEDASTTKPHVSETGEYGTATTLVYGHAKISDNFESGDQALAGTLLSPFGFQQAVARLQGLKETKLFTTSTTWIVPETGTYKITCVGGGGKGGNGQDGYFTQQCFYRSTDWGNEYSDSNNGGYGGAGGGAGQTITSTLSLTKGTVIQITIGAANGGTTKFGTQITALGGGNGGLGSAVGTSYGSAATAGAAGQFCECATWDTQFRAMGGAGGKGGTSIDGTYGNGGTGGNGGSCGITWSDAPYILPGSVGANGVQGCVTIQMLSEVNNG